MEYTTLRDVAKSIKLIPRSGPTPPPPRKPPSTPAKPRCPSGHRWDSKKGKCVQAGVGPKYKP